MTQKDLRTALLAAFSMSAAWWVPGSLWGALLGWIAAFCIVLLASSTSTPYRTSFVSGVLIHPLAFYWLFGTIQNFGGFPMMAAAAVFTLFALLSALQYPLFILLHRGLPKFLDGFALRTAIAWTVTELIAVRIFPWCLGHTQLGFVPFAQGAALAGALLISFLMLWGSEVILKVARGEVAWVRIIPPGVAIGLVCLFGGIHAINFSKLSGPVHKVALLQANVSIEEKHNMRMVVTNRERYVELSRQVLNDNALIIWPESAIQEFLPDLVGNAVNEPRLPYWQGTFSSFLLGSVTYEDRAHVFNSAVAIYRDGTVPRPYHKRILMPFGEFVPFAKIFPWLRDLSGMPNDFTAGSRPSVFDYPLDGAGEEKLAVSPLICYEDVVPSLSREAVQAGAELLVNLTNDGWFGNTIAPVQHHLIASFRAIENYRFLLRSTNTGLTAIVDPLGRTVSTLPPYSEGILKGEIIPLQSRTLYTVFGNLPWYLLTVLTLFCGLVTRVVRWRR